MYVIPCSDPPPTREAFITPTPPQSAQKRRPKKAREADPVLDEPVAPPKESPKPVVRPKSQAKSRPQSSAKSRPSSRTGGRPESRAKSRAETRLALFGWVVPSISPPSLLPHKYQGFVPDADDPLAIFAAQVY